MPRTQQTYLCSFCGKAKEQVTRLIAGPGVYICDECVALCAEIIAEERRGEPPASSASSAPSASSGQVMAFVLDFGDRVFDALLTLGYQIEISDDGAISARCESATIPAAPPRLVGRVEPDCAITWAEAAVAQRALFAARIVALRSRI